MKLIFLEDDALILEFTQEALALAGFEVLPATSGEDALQLLSETPECLAMMIDVRLQSALDGWEVARLARSRYPDLAIIYTTTADTPDFERERVDRSVLLQKPYTLDRAVSAAREACHKVD
jgi:DNA-binding NtrC family response regulator